MSRFGALDGLRAVSVIAVVWHHTSGAPRPAIATKGYLGVDFFFAISGFLITTLLVRERAATGGISLRRFYARRALRIFPLYYATLLLYVILVIATQRHNPEGQRFLHHLPAYATYTSNWFVHLENGAAETFYFAWSLATEEQFYVLWPPLLVVALSISRRRIWAPLLVLAVLVTASQAAGVITDTSRMPGAILSSLSLPILAGSAAALVVNTPHGFARVATVLGRAWSAPVFAITLLCALAVDTPSAITQCLMVCVVVALCLHERTPLHPVLQWRPLQFIGVISYGVYLLHMLCANVVFRSIAHEHNVPVFAATLALTITAAYVSFRFFETPLLRIKRRFESARQRRGDELGRISPIHPRTDR